MIRCLFFFLLAVKFNVNDSRRDLLHHIGDEVVLVTETVGVLLPWQQKTQHQISPSVSNMRLNGLIG